MAIDDLVNRCWSRSDLEVYAKGRLTQGQVASFESHLELCGRCQQLLAEIFESGTGPDWLPLNDSDSSDSQAAAHQLWRNQQTDIEEETLQAQSQTTPETVGRYRVERLLGVGGFGRVYLARDETLKRNVALKIPHQSVIGSPQHLELLLEEAQTVAALDHAGIAPIYDVGSTPDVPLFLVSKLIEGRTLAQLTSDKQLDVVSIVQLVIEVAEALQFAHNCGVIHRDLKPQNILIDQSGQVFLTDFGLAWRAAVGSRRYPQAGTPAYMSPEQLSDQPEQIDQRSDIYSLGKILCELLMRDGVAAALGQMGFSDSVTAALSVSKSTETVHDMQGEIITWHDGLAPDPLAVLPSALRKICSRATAPELQRRYERAGDMANDLRAFLTAIGAPLVRPGPAPAALASTHLQSIPPAVNVLWPQWLNTRVAWLALVGLTVVVSWWIWMASQRQQTQGVIDELMSAPWPLVTQLIEKHRPLRKPWVALLERERVSRDSERRLRAQMALSPDDPVLARALAEVMLDSPAEIAVQLARCLKPHAEQLKESMWTQITIRPSDSDIRLINAFTFLATHFPDDVRWTHTNVQNTLATLIIQEDISSIAARTHCYRQIRFHLIAAIEKALENHLHVLAGDQHAKVYSLWDEIVREDPQASIHLMLKGPPWIFTKVLSRLKNDEPTISCLRQHIHELAEKSSASTSQLQSRHLAALALLSMGYEDEYWNLWHYSDDPQHLTTQSSIVGYGPLHAKRLSARLKQLGALRPLKVAPQGFRERLYRADLVQRRHLMIGLAKLAGEQLSAAQMQELDHAAQNEYSSSADSALHAVAEYWLNFHDASLPKLSSLERHDANWSVNSQGETMVHIESIPEVGYAFALASHELQQHQFQQFLSDSGYPWKGQSKNELAQLNHPQTELSWYDCAAFCNWLSQREGLEEVYQPNAAGLYAEGMRIAPDALNRNGYRLPTGQEWEVGCRAGTIGRHYFGDSNFWAQHYAWFHPVANTKLQAVARLRPNDLGLFDTLGNASEWILDAEGNHPLEAAISDRVARVHRGGSFEQELMEVTATAARTAGPAEHLPMLGMRLARSRR